MSSITCPNNCDRSEEPYPFYYPACCLWHDDEEGCAPEVGIYCDEDAKLSDMWTDDTRGADGWHDDECLPHCSTCSEQTYYGPEEIECTYNKFDPSSYGCACGACEREKYPDV